MSTPKISSGIAGPSAAARLFSLDLTRPQRAALLDATWLPPQILERFESLPRGEQSVAFSRKELDQILDALSEAALQAREPQRKHLAAVLNKIDELLDTLCREPGRPLARRRPELDCDVRFQFKVTLLDLEPAVWRRLQLEDGTLGDLHGAIQAAFGWRDEQQHRFAIEGIAYGRPPDLDFGFGWGSDCTPETAVRLSELAPPSGRRARWIYEYDCGDGWRHEVLFEGYPPKEAARLYPVCCEGALACPPEHVGGPWGYVDFLQAGEDPEDGGRQPRGERTEPFDPEVFDPKEATRAMRKSHIYSR